MLEYAAIADPDDGPALLQEYRPSLELLRFALLDDRQPVRRCRRRRSATTLPGASPADRAAVHRMAADGPPREEVGLDAYDPRLLPLVDSRRSTAMNVLLWGVLPYVVLAVLVGGTIWRYRYDQFGWTTRSSQLYESRLLRIGSPLFHFGILFVLVGHIVRAGHPEVAGPTRSA